MILKGYRKENQCQEKRVFRPTVCRWGYFAYGQDGLSLNQTSLECNYRQTKWSYFKNTSEERIRKLLLFVYESI
ncbi:unnamed protein product [Nezara viridula]|uniref:Uncharacterized protein n=1 Tax=Nezara viridula TaxID=85310 RepID=A0A9P0ECF0_NEZVI|nr:unnamed protein product [Nezara viridula]